jgi:hypothetical protein
MNGHRFHNIRFGLESAGAVDSTHPRSQYIHTGSRALDLAQEESHSVLAAFLDPKPPECRKLVRLPPMPDPLYLEEP